MSREVQAGTLCILFFLLMVGCGGERGSGAAPADSAKPSAAADTAVAPASDTSASRRDTTSKAQAPAVAQKKPAAPASKPAAPKAEPAPAAQPPSMDRPTTDAPKAKPSAEATPSADAPLRDAYHQAPLDTVTEVAYDGWKQYNLNCARCHGEDVQGTTIAPHLIVSLRPDGPINTKEIFIQTVCAGRPAKGMPSWCALGMDMGKIESIYSYVKGRSDGKIHPGRPAVKPAG